ncbi:MAG: hypothetical protein WCP03_00195 [Candidatus Saccharibacteria bacterium]
MYKEPKYPQNYEQEPQVPEMRLIIDSQLELYYPHLYQAAMFGIDDVVQMMSRMPKVNVDYDQIVGTDATLEQLLDDSTIYNPNPNVQEGQLLFDNLYHLIQTSTGPQGYFHNFILTARGMTISDGEGGLNNFVLGANLDNTTVQSLYEYIMSDNLTEQQKCDVTRHIARHEYGHMVGLDQATIANPDPRGEFLPIYAGHCANFCTMHQSISTEEAVGLSSELRHHRKMDAGFCPDCVNYIRSI